MTSAKELSIAGSEIPLQSGFRFAAEVIDRDEAGLVVNVNGDRAYLPLEHMNGVALSALIEGDFVQVTAINDGPGARVRLV